MRKIQKGKCGTARMTPAQKVGFWEESVLLSRRRRAIFRTDRGGLGGYRATAIGVNVDTRLRQKSPLHRSARGLRGIGVRMMYLFRVTRCRT